MPGSQGERLKPVTALLAAATLAAVASTTGPRDDASAAPRDSAREASRPVHAAPAATTLRPFYFETNRGQAPVEFDLFARCDGYRAWVGSQAIVVAGRERGIRLAFDGAAKVPADAAEHVIPGHVNYLIGKDESKWIREIPVTNGGTWRGVTPGADLTVGGDGRRLEFAFDLAPGAQPPSMTVTGATEVRITDAGELRAATPEGAATFSAPIAWQETETGRQSVAAKWAISGASGVQFVLGAHDATLPVTIDPTVSWETYVGGGASDVCGALDVGPSGDVYFGGSTYSAGFPTTSGAYDTTRNGVSSRNDAFLTRMTADGSTLVFSTLIGGLLDDSIAHIAVDPLGRAVVSGLAGDSNYPTTGGAYLSPPAVTSGGVVTRFDSAGANLVASTFAGETAYQLELSPVSGIYVRTSVGAMKLTDDLSALSWNVRITPTSSTGNESTNLNDLAVDVFDNVWICGRTSQNNLTLTTGHVQSKITGKNDGLIVRLSPSGVKSIVTVIGGSGEDEFTAIEPDAGGRPIIAGVTGSSNYPLTLGAAETNKPAYDVAFVTKVDAGVTTIRSSSLFCTAGDRVRPMAIAVHLSGVYAIGGLCFGSLPVSNEFQSSHGGDIDGFLARFERDDSRSWISYAGGSSSDYIAALAMDQYGSIVACGATQSSDHPTVAAYDSTHGGSDDAVILRIADSLAPYELPSVAAQTLPVTTVGVACPHQFTATKGLPPYSWNPTPMSGALPAGLFLTPQGGFVGAPTATGTFSFRVGMEDAVGGLADNVITLTVNKVATPNGAGVPQWTVNVPCDLGLQLKDGSPPFTWEFVSGTLPAGLTLDAAGRLKGTPTSTGNHVFTARFTDSVGAVSTGTFTARINTPPTIPAQTIPAATAGAAFSYDMLLSSGTAPFTWSVVGGASPVIGGIQTDGELGVTAAAAGDYSFTLRATDAAGVFAERALTATVNPVPAIATPRLPPASTGRRYRSQLTAIDGTPPFTWEITNGAAVDGLVFQPESGTFLGTPLSHGRIPIALRATDRWGAQAERTIEIDVATPVDLTKRAAGETIQLPVGKAPPFFRALELLAGTKLGISVSGGAYDGVAPDVTLTGEDGQPIDLVAYSKTTAKSVTIRNFPVPATGRYFLLVEPQEGAKGKVKLKVTAAQQSAWSGTVEVDAAGAPVPVVFSAPPGAKLSISVTRAKGSAATPSIAGLTDDDDTDLAAGGKLAEKKTSASLRPAPLTLGGDLTLLLGARDGTAGAVNWKVTFAPPRSNDFELPDLTAGDE